MKIFWIVFSIVVGIILLLAVLDFIIGYILCKYYAQPHRWTREESMNELVRRNVSHDYDTFKKEDSTLTMRDGTILHTRFIPAEEKTNKYVIIAHGWTVNLIYDAKYIKIFRDLGYNCFTYDQRGHGDNDRKDNCTMSIEETKDLLEIIDYVKKTYGENIYLGLHGESMGGATVIQSMKYSPKVEFIIADCPYARLIDVSVNNAKALFHLPKFVVDTASLPGRIFFHYDPNKIRPIDDINNSKMPLLVCTGKCDKMIPYTHSIEIYDKYQGYKEIHLTDGAEHAESVNVDYEGYKKAVVEFLEHIERK